MKINCKISSNQHGIIERKNMAECPKCQQKLTEVILVKGSFWVRMHCRRCHTYIDVAASEF